MKIIRSRENGQAIVLIALALVVLLAFLALAVDGGNMYVHRRLAQNASDSGAMGGAMNLLVDGTTDAGVRGTILDRAAENGIDLTDPRNVVHGWYIDSQGNRISDIEIGLWGYIPIDQGAAGVEVKVDTQFDAFIAQIIGLNELTAQADSGAVVMWPTFCADWVFYSNCNVGSGNCYNSALNLSGSLTMITGGGIHSNSGLHTTGSNFTLNPPRAEWGTPGICTGNVCPEMGGPAYQVPPQPMPRLYEWEQFQPGGYWWNDMCQGDSADLCHTSNGIGPNDVISEGLWVINGNVQSPRFFDPTQTHYTFALTGNFSFNGQMPVWEPFEGSSTQGGSKAFIFSTAQDPGGVGISGATVDWYGMVYVPHGLASISASGDHSGEGAVFAWRIDLSGANMTIHHDTYYCPPEQAKVTLLW